jgi:hypothetical protein
VLESPDKDMPIGMAFENGRTDEGLAVWRLTIRGEKVPMLWIIVDGEFKPVQLIGRSC